MEGEIEITKVIDLSLEELNRAQIKHPGWPDDKIHAAAILGEESGELLQACIDYEYEKEPGDDEKYDHHMRRMQEEAVQCGAMAIRFLLHLK